MFCIMRCSSCSTDPATELVVQTEVLSHLDDCSVVKVWCCRKHWVKPQTHLRLLFFVIFYTSIYMNYIYSIYSI